MNSKYTKILLALTICLLMSACSDDIFSGSDYFDNGKVTLRLVVPATTVVNTRANTEATNSVNDLKDLYVIEYDDKGSCVAMRKVDPSNIIDNTTLTINDVNATTTDIHIVANGEAILATKDKGNIKKLDGVYSNKIPVYSDKVPSPPVLWGHIKMSELKSGTSNTVSLLRNVAKATLNKADSISDKFVISGWEITKTANQGSIAPKNYIVPKNYTVGNTNEPTGDNLDKTRGDSESSNAGEALYLFETPATVDSRIVIKANEKYYTANFLDGTDGTGSKLPLLRNHHYKITVTATGEGYNTKKEALDALAGNIKVEIKDYNFMVTNLISNGAYELGTCDTVRVDANGEIYSVGGAYFVTMWGDENAKNITPSLSDPTVKWLTDVSKDTGTPISSTYSSAGKGYKLTFTCAKNPSEEIRQTKLTVTFGVLKRDIVIVQQGSNLKKARTTMIYGLQGDGITGRDYNVFISNEVKGISRTAMGGTSERDKGLQLGIGIGSEYNYHYTYTIKKETGDNISQVDGAFEVDDKTNGDYYTIKAKDPNDESVWTGRFTITTKDGHEIIYDIYHTGIFWEEKDTYQPASNHTTGWYYYELIKSKNGVWMLDRNLGAASVDDPGGYYRIKKGGKDSDMTDICPPGFSIPTATLWKQLPVMKLVTRTTGNGTTYQSIELPAATTAQSKSIRFPCGGMHNGYKVTNPSIGYYWSATIVSGNQGFDSNSKEYGYWYNVARLSSGSQSMQNVRYVGGSDGISTGVYKYLNTRCVKSSSAVLDKNRLTIHDKRKSDKPLYIYIHTEYNEYRNRRYGEMIRSTGGSETTIYYDMIDPERIMESIGKPLYIRFRQGDDLVDSGWIDVKKLVGDQREFTVHDKSFE